MHAEDQLMSAETIKMMALEIIKLNQRLYSLENKKEKENEKNLFIL